MTKIVVYKSGLFNMQNNMSWIQVNLKACTQDNISKRFYVTKKTKRRKTQKTALNVNKKGSALREFVEFEILDNDDNKNVPTRTSVDESEFIYDYNQMKVTKAEMSHD